MTRPIESRYCSLHMENARPDTRPSDISGAGENEVEMHRFRQAFPNS